MRARGQPTRPPAPRVMGGVADRLRCRVDNTRMAARSSSRTRTPASACGYASEAAHALVDCALAQDGVDAVVAGCAPDNIASVRTLERLGFTPTGSEGDDMGGAADPRGIRLDQRPAGVARP